MAKFRKLGSEAVITAFGPVAEAYRKNPLWAEDGAPDPVEQALEPTEAQVDVTDEQPEVTEPPSPERTSKKGADSESAPAVLVDDDAPRT